LKIKILILIILIFSTLSFVQGQQVEQLTSIEAEKMMRSNRKLVVIDVRTADEFNQGHIKGAINIDIKQSEAFDKINKLDHNAIYTVHCRTNHRSTAAVNHMVEKGFKNIYQMTDGFNGWSTNEFPLTKGNSYQIDNQTYEKKLRIKPKIRGNKRIF
jgi:phage shock protein E